MAKFLDLNTKDGKLLFDDVKRKIGSGGEEVVLLKNCPRTMCGMHPFFTDIIEIFEAGKRGKQFWVACECGCLVYHIKNVKTAVFCYE